MKIKVWNRDDKQETFIFKPGVTMLIGPNGTGKTTILKQIDSIFNKGGWEKIRYNDKLRDEYSCYIYDNVYEENRTKSEWGFTGELEKIAASFEMSEGQNMYNYLMDKVCHIGEAVRKAKKNKKKGIFILLDGLDSGLSPDVLKYLKENLLDFIIKEENCATFECYILCSANSYEFCSGYHCIDVSNNCHYDFVSYDEFINSFKERSVI